MTRQRGFSLIFYLVAGIALLALIGTFLYQVRESGKDAVYLEWGKAAAEQRAREAAQSHKAADNLEKGNAKAKIVYRTIRESVDRVVERDVYRNVCLDPDGLQLAQRAIRGGESADPAVPDKPLPGAPAPR